MKFEIRRYGFAIIPETDQDTAFIEEVLKLRENGDAIKLVRSNAIDLSCMGLLETETDWHRSRFRDQGGPRDVNAPDAAKASGGGNG
jgi:hypothetical protein